MKILYIAAAGTRAYRARHNDTGFELGGLRKAEMTLEALTMAEHEVVMLSAATTGNRITWRGEEREAWRLGSGREVEVRYPATIPYRPFGGLVNSMRAPWVARGLLGDFTPDRVVVYNTYLFESLVALALHRRTGVPLIVQIEDLPLSRRREYGNVKPWLDQRCWPHMLRAASGFTTVNESIVSMLPEGKPTRLLPGIIDDRLIATADARVPPFSTGRRTLGYFGALTNPKGVRVLLEAVESLPDPWRIRVAGSGPLAAEFEALARERPDRLEFLGNITGDALYDAICSCDATAVPLEQITAGGAGVFPFKILEYLVAGTHLIATPQPSIGDVELGFIERWDGSAAGLVSELGRAEAAYAEEGAIREAAIGAARSRFTVAGACRLFSELLQA